MQGTLGSSLSTRASGHMGRAHSGTFLGLHGDRKWRASQQERREAAWVMSGHQDLAQANGRSLSGLQGTLAMIIGAQGKCFCEPLR